MDQILREDEEESYNRILHDITRCEIAVYIASISRIIAIVAVTLCQVHCCSCYKSVECVNVSSVSFILDGQ